MLRLLLPNMLLREEFRSGLGAPAGAAAARGGSAGNAGFSVCGGGLPVLLPHPMAAAVRHPRRRLVTHSTRAKSDGYDALLDAPHIPAITPTSGRVSVQALGAMATGEGRSATSPRWRQCAQWRGASISPPH